MKNYLFYSAVMALTLVSCGKPVANFMFSEEKTVAPATVQFSNQSKDALRYEWDFGDGDTSSQASPTHTYKSSGNYAVRLKASKEGKSRVIEKRIMITAPVECLVEIETEFGNMTVLLYNSTPQHRDNFIKLADEGFFNDLLFHRVIEGFMIQGGDPTSRNAKPKAQLGSGGPNYTLPAEFMDSLVHIKGALSAARQGDQVNPEKRSSGSQFYLVQGKPLSQQEVEAMESRKGIRYTKEQRDAYMTLGGTPFLDRDYTVFGKVIQGLDVIDKIAAVETLPGDRPKTDVKMKIRVIK